jgi:hypothetical protein
LTLYGADPKLFLSRSFHISFSLPNIPALNLNIGHIRFYVGLFSIAKAE